MDGAQVCEADFFVRTLPLLRESPDIALVRLGGPASPAGRVHAPGVHACGRRTRQRRGAPACSAAGACALARLHTAGAHIERPLGSPDAPASS